MAKQKPGKPKGHGFTVRCGPAYRAWVARLLEETGDETVSHMVAKALAAYAARRRGFPKPPRRPT